MHWVIYSVYTLHLFEISLRSRYFWISDLKVFLWYNYELEAEFLEVILVVDLQFKEVT